MRYPLIESTTPALHGHLRAFDSPRNRSGTTLIELAIVLTLMAIATAVALPRWSASVEKVRLANMSRAITADFDYLCRTSMRQCLNRTVTIPRGASFMTISPPSPGVLGDATGRVDYSQRFPGVVFSAINFDGKRECTLDVHGQIVSSNRGERVSVGQVTLSGPSGTQTVDLLTGR